MHNFETPNPSYGDLFTWEDFYQACKVGMFIDYDGNGEASNGTHVDPGSSIKPSDVEILQRLGTHPTHVMWYNK